MLAPVLVLAVGVVLIISAMRMSQSMRDGADKPAFGFGNGGQEGLSNPIMSAGSRVKSKFDRRPLLPVADRPPLGARIPLQRVESRMEEYVVDGMKALQVHLMQAARGTGWRVDS